EAPVAESQPHLLESGLAAAGLGLEPVEAVARAGRAYAEVLLDVVAAREQRGRTAAERLADRLDRDLIEVLVVHPQLRAVAYDQLLVGLFVRPADAARPHEVHRAARLLELAHVAVVHDLREPRAARAGVAQVILQCLEGCRRRRDAREQQDRNREELAHGAGILFAPSGRGEALGSSHDGSVDAAPTDLAWTAAEREVPRP